MLIVAIGLLVAGAMVLFSPWGIHARRMKVPLVPPEFRWSIKVDGVLVDVEGKQMINVVVGSLVEPSVEVEWNGHGPGQIELTMENTPISPGARLTMRGLGFSELQYSSIGQTWAAIDSIVLKINAYPRLDATVHPVAVETGDGGPLDIRAVTVRFSSDEFDIRNIWLSHVSLWLEDDKRLTLGDGLSIAKRAGDGMQGEAQPGADPTKDEAGLEYIATFEGGLWTLRFERPADAAPLASWPTHLSVTGSGWRGEETVEFVARGPFAAVADDDR
ncbi:MAG: hypothetical protein KIT88_03875 [Phycisphaeraceae bacterium]|nr:hypothetical protein [Phycisphaeraceae bacterium]